jgi:hypothetical protein
MHQKSDNRHGKRLVTAAGFSRRGRHDADHHPTALVQGGACPLIGQSETFRPKLAHDRFALDNGHRAQMPTRPRRAMGLNRSRGRAPVARVAQLSTAVASGSMGNPGAALAAVATIANEKPRRSARAPDRNTETQRPARFRSGPGAVDTRRRVARKPGHSVTIGGD